MAMFGGRSPEKKFDWGRAALGFFGGPSVVQSMSRQDALELEREKQEQQSKALSAVRSGLKARGYRDTDIDVILANPENASKLITETLVTRQGGAEGMTVRSIDPGTGAASTETTAGWHNGDYFGGSSGSGAPQRLYQGEKVFPVEKGGYLGVYGGPQGGTPAATPQATPGARSDEAALREQAAEAIRNGADPAAVAERLQRMIGGAGSAASPRTFRPY